LGGIVRIRKKYMNFGEAFEKWPLRRSELVLRWKYLQVVKTAGRWNYLRITSDGKLWH
jgi:hypothetical protein